MIYSIYIYIYPIGDLNYIPEQQPRRRASCLDKVVQEAGTAQRKTQRVQG